MSKPVKVKAYSIKDVVQQVQLEAIENRRKFDESGGICINCEKNPGDTETLICKDCQNEIDDLVKQLQGPGFVQMGIKVKTKKGA